MPTHKSVRLHNANYTANLHEFTDDDDASTAAVRAVLGIERLNQIVLDGNGDAFDGNRKP